MMVLETVAAALVALAVIALIVSPLAGRQVVIPSTVDDPEDLDETPKGIALAALREIEFDKATGKLSDEDYQLLKTKYTAEALAVLRSEETGKAPAAAAGTAPASDDPVEALVAEKVRLLQEGATKCPTCGPRPEGDALYCSSCGRSLTVGGCAECGAPLVPGSRFCENCGVAVAK
ncbi:MAG: zinc ribbon domain-containing protein [Gemmatimonadales bacterium]